MEISVPQTKVSAPKLKAVTPTVLKMNKVNLSKYSTPNILKNKG